MDIDVDFSAVLNIYIFDIEERIQRKFEAECAIEASAATSKEQQSKLYDLSRQARAHVIIFTNQISLQLYYVSIPDNTDDYAELIIHNAYDVIKPYFYELIQEILSYPDIKEKLIEQSAFQIKQYMFTEMQSVIGGV